MDGFQAEAAGSWHAGAGVGELGTASTTDAFGWGKASTEACCVCREEARPGASQQEVRGACVWISSCPPTPPQTEERNVLCLPRRGEY